MPQPSIFEFAGGEPAFVALAAAHHVRCLQDRLPDDIEFRNALRAYMTWAVGEVLAYAPGDAQVPTGLPIRHWTWSGPE